MIGRVIMSKWIVSIALCFVLFPLLAHAYVGPGIGVGVIGAIVGIFVAIFLSIAGLFWFPIKRAMKRKKESKKTDEEAQEQH